MTAIYWFWKNNLLPDYVGFAHYRRVFSDADIADYEDHDIIVSKPIWSSDRISLAYQYKHYHVLSDLQTCIDTIRETDPEWGESFRQYLLHSGTNYAPCNMFVMKKELFEEWCSFVFPVLTRLKDKICGTEEFKKRDNYQKRALCFLTERMFGYWYFLKKKAGLRTKEVEMVEHLEYKPKGVNERGDFGKPLPKVALVAIAKDEDHYLKEWVDYHLKIGFSEIFVYQNNWRYRGGDIDDPRVHLEVLDGHRMQNKCYNDFIENYKESFDFAIFLDVDEFFYMRDSRNVCEFIGQFEHIPAVFVNWRLFGDNGLKKVDGDYSVINRFTKSDDKLHPLGKQILNLKATRGKVIFYNPHILQYKDPPTREFRSQDPSGKLRCTCGCIHNNTESESCEVYHFRNKTWEENVMRKYNTDDAFHEADQCDFRRNMTAVKRQFDEHNKNIVDNFNLKEIYACSGD